MKGRKKVVLDTLCLANISISFKIFIGHIQKNLPPQVVADAWQHVHCLHVAF